MTTPSDAFAPNTPPSTEALEKSLSEALKKVEELQEKIASLEAQHLRDIATQQNLEKRHLKDLGDRENRVKHRLIESTILPVADTLDLAQTHSDDEGIHLVHQSFQKTLQEIGLTALEPLDQPFDIHQHEALSTQKDPEKPHHTILQVLQKGYKLNDQLIRPARVIVSENSDS